MGVGNHSQCGVCCFLTDRGSEAFGPGEKMQAHQDSKVKAIWKWFGDQFPAQMV